MIELSAASPADEQRVWPVHLAAFAHIAARAMGDGWRERTRREFGEAWACEQVRLVWARLADATEESTLVGYVQVEPRGGDRFLKTMALAPRFQGRGLGAQVLERLQEEAAQAGATLTLSVYETNRARRLYARCGFVRLGQDGVRIRMRWCPPGRPVPFDPATWGWERPRVTPVLVGENELLRVDAPGGSFAVRLYRRGRRTRGQIEAEWAWAGALAESVPVATAVRTRDGGLVAEAPDGRFAVAMPWIEGRVATLETPAQARRLGRLLAELRAAADRVQRERSPWAGDDRPVYDPEADIQATLKAYAGPTFATEEQLVALRGGAERLWGALDGLPLPATAWVHADVHRWNVLDDGARWWLIDLDDSGFASPETELSTIRTHLRAGGQLERLRGALMEGWGPHEPRRVALAAAVHVFATMGEFPGHLDIEPLSVDPGATLDRYLSYLDAELREATGTGRGP